MRQGGFGYPFKLKDFMYFIKINDTLVNLDLVENIFIKSNDSPDIATLVIITASGRVETTGTKDSVKSAYQKLVNCYSHSNREYAITMP